MLWPAAVIGVSNFTTAARFSKPALDRPAGQDSVGKLYAHRVRTGRSTAAAIIAAGVERAPSPVLATGSPPAVPWVVVQFKS